MSLKTLISCIIVILVLTSDLLGQNTGKVRLNIIPSYSYIEINNKVIKVSEQEVIELNEGLYPIRIWASKMMMIEDTIEIKADETVNYNKGLRELSPDYKVYRKQLRQYKFNRAKPYGLAGLALGSGIGGFFLLNQQKAAVQNSQNEALIATSIYENAVVNIDIVKANYEEKVAEFNRKKTTYNTSLVASIIGVAALTSFSIIQIRKNRKTSGNKPIYQEKNPLVYEKVKITPTLNYQNSDVTIGFTLQF